MKAHCSIILINWNGWIDTIECLETVLKQDYPNFDIVLVDNGSDDESLMEIKKWSKTKYYQIQTQYSDLVFPIYNRPIQLVAIQGTGIECFLENNILEAEKEQPKIYLLMMNSNLGFAKSNNIAISFAIKYFKGGYLYLLNNDTVIKRDTVSNLVHAANISPDYSAFQSAIYYYNDPNKIWGVGARIFPWAQTKYYKSIGKNELKPVSFVTGCALFFKSDLINSIGSLSEKFFHGEEDFEFSMRLKKYKLKACVVAESKIYHKIAVSASKQWVDNAEKILNSALNRIINIRDYFPNYKWKVWRIFTLFYFYLLMILKYNLSISFSFKLILEIFKKSSNMNNVKRTDIQKILSNI